MPIEIACASCGKRYRVDEKFAGKKVKCKACGNAIEVPSAEGVEDDDLAALTSAAMSMESMASQAGIDSPPPPPSRPVMPDDDDDFPAPASSELPDGFGPAIAAARARLSNRPYRLFRYPGNAFVDMALPWLITLGCLTGVIWPGVTDMLTHKTPDDPMWIPAVEYSVVFLLFLGLVVPVSTRGLRMASNQLHFPLPDSTVWRMLSVCSVCFVLATAMFWQIGVPGVVLGAAVGVLIAWPLVWLFFSLHWAEAIVAWMMSSLFILGGGAVVAVITVVISLISAAALTSEAKPTKIIAKVPKVVATAPAGTDTTQMSDGSTTMPAVADNTGTTTAPATQQDSTAVALVPQTQPADNSTPGDIVFTPVKPTAPTPTTEPGEIMPGVAAVKPKSTGSPLIASATPLDWLGGVMAMIPSNAPGASVAVLRSSGTEQTVVVANNDQTKAAASISFKPDTGGVDQSCFVTPNGQDMVRLVTWPKLAAQVTSVADSTVLQSLLLGDAPVRPTIIGIPSADVVAMRYDGNNQSGLEIWSLKTGTRIKQVKFPVAVEAGIAFSADGKHAAALGKSTDGGAAQLLIADLFAGAQTRRLAITALDPQWASAPAGLEFSPDGTKIALAMEHETGVLIVTWNLATGRTIGEPALFPPGMLAIPSRDQFKGNALSWVDANTWLLYGRTMIDAATGKSLGTLDIDRVTAQRVVSDGVIDLLATGDDGAGHVQKVTLSADGITKARGPAAGPTTAK